MDARRSAIGLSLRRLVSVVASLALALSLCPAVAFGAETGGLYFGTVKFDHSSTDVVAELKAADSSATVTGEASFEFGGYAGGTLTLKNFTYKGAGFLDGTDYTS